MKFKESRKTEGFTLEELLIVVAIIAVLVAISILVFSGTLKKAKIATCQANQRSLKAALSAEYMLGDSTRFAFAQDGEIQLTDEERKEYPCPDGGKYLAMMESGFITVSCNNLEHDTGDDINVQVADTFAKVFEGYINAVNGTNKNLNSDYAENENSETNKMLSGLDITFLKAGVWQVNSKTFTWTESINKTSSSIENVPAVQYNKETGKYSICTVTLGKSENGGLIKNGRIADNSIKLVEGYDSYNTYKEALIAYEEYQNK